MKSPCVRRCRIDSQQVCQACFCSLDEIVSWHDASDDERRRIAARADARRAVTTESEEMPAAQLA